MATRDACCTLVPYFTIHEGKLEEFKSLCGKFVDKTKTEPGCMFYGFTFDGLEAHCREGYQDAEGVLAHLENVGDILDEALKISELHRLEVHGPAGELDKLREPLQDLDVQYYNLELGFRR